MKLQITQFAVVLYYTLLNIKTNLTDFVSTSIGRYANIKMPNIIKTGVNINSCLLVELMFLLDKNLSSGENQGPGNRNKTNVAPKTNIDTCSYGSSWYSKKRYKRIFTTNPWETQSNKNPENFTKKHSTYSEKSVIYLNQ